MWIPINYFQTWSNKLKLDKKDNIMSYVWVYLYRINIVMDPPTCGACLGSFASLHMYYVGMHPLPQTQSYSIWVHHTYLYVVSTWRSKWICMCQTLNLQMIICFVCPNRSWSDRGRSAPSMLGRLFPWWVFILVIHKKVAGNWVLEICPRGNNKLVIIIFPYSW